MQLALEGLGKSFGRAVALEGISFTAAAPEFVCLLGPSGCGKTTLLRLIAGLTEPDTGAIRINGEDLARTPARQRGFGIVFQAYSLFPNMTVAGNIGYGLRIRGERTAAIKARVDELLNLIQLPQLADRYPWQLSGGQQQRVALARAVAVAPKVLLLDEPLSALDAKVRVELRSEIRALQKRLGILTIMVTHDQEEALTLSDRVVCMQGGRIAQIGTPKDLYHRPVNRFVADFMGISNLIDFGTVQRLAPSLLEGQSAEASKLLCLRPEDIRIVAGGTGARVKSVQFLGNVSRLHIDWVGGPLVVEQSGETALAAGAEVGIAFLPAQHAWVSTS